MKKLKEDSVIQFFMCSSTGNFAHFISSFRGNPKINEFFFQVGPMSFSKILYGPIFQ